MGRFALLLLLVFGLVLVSELGLSEGKPKKKGKSKSKKPKNIFYGATPAGATKWLSDSQGSIYTDVDISHLGLDRLPRYICSVSASKNVEKLKASDVYSAEGLALTNVTGKNYPRQATAKGFRVRLKYGANDPRNLTASVARLGNWRVRWVAITDDHPIMSKLLEENEDVHPSYFSPIAYVNMLSNLVEEKKSFVYGLFDRDYALALSQRPKPKPKKEKKEEKKEEEKAGEEEQEKAGEESEKDDATKESESEKSEDSSSEQS